MQVFIVWDAALRRPRGRSGGSPSRLTAVQKRNTIPIDNRALPWVVPKKRVCT